MQIIFKNEEQVAWVSQLINDWYTERNLDVKSYIEKLIFKECGFEVIKKSATGSYKWDLEIDGVIFNGSLIRQLDVQGVMESINGHHLIVDIDIVYDYSLKKELKDAVNILAKYLREDEDIYQSYQANIAMAFYDNVRWYCETQGIKYSMLTPEKIHSIANLSARYFLDLFSKEK